MKKKYVSTTLLVSTLLLSSCATMRSSPFIGGAVGMAGGSVAGAAIGESMSGTLIGAGSGLLIGSLIGLLVQKNEDQHSTSAKETFQTQAGDDESPALSTPKVKRTWQADKVENDHYIKGHYIYLIERGSQWVSH